MSHAPLRHFLHLVATTLAAVTLWACANPGSGPDGGPYDETPPHIVSMTPAIGSVNIKTKKVSLLFDELIKVENPSEKVTVSPPQMEVPEIKVSGRRVNVSLSDSLKPNTTYTIDFSDAIEDSNEGNPLGNFTYFFSTGGAIDTMEIAGYVLAAENLEPQKGLLVGLHSDLNDSAFTALPFERVARTDSRGHFCIKGIAPGTYRIYALKDIDGDFKMSRGEMMAALRQDITPTCFPDVRQDTAWHDSIHYDSISIVHFTHYKPDDLVLRAFSPVRTDRQFLKSQRDEPEWFRMYFTAASTERPKITGLNFNADELLLEQANATNDTITYWLRTIDLPQVDSLRMTYTYDVYDDSLACNVWQTDTLELVPRHTMARRLKQQAEDNEKWQKQLEKRHKRGDYSQEKPPQQFLRLNTLSGSGMPLLYNPTVTFDEPITRLDTTAIHLRLRQDSVMVDAPMALVINPLIIFAYLRCNPYPLVLRCLKESGLTAFFTRSSAANIPVNMALCEKLGMDRDMYSVSIPLGATINMDGAAVTITIMTLAAANTLGIEVSFSAAIVLAFMSALGACGASGVAGGSLLLIPMACSLFGISNDIAMQMVGVGFIIGVVQDSVETALNSAGDVEFAATAEFYQWRKEGRPLPDFLKK